MLTTIVDHNDTMDDGYQKGYLSLRRRKQFAMVQPSTASRIDLGRSCPPPRQRPAGWSRRPSSRKAADMPPIPASAEIDRPAVEVFAYATDPARFSQWQQGVVDGHMDGPGNSTQPPAVGTKCVTTRRIGGASRLSTSELTHIDPPRTWGVRGIDGPVRAEVEVLVEPLAGSRGSTQGNARQHGRAQAEHGSRLRRPHLR